MSTTCKYGSTSALALTMLLSACGGSDHTAASLIAESSVATSTGTFRGVPSSNGTVTGFKGIRYAAAPVGELRWRPPQVLANVKPEAVTASMFGATCPQRQASRKNCSCWASGVIPASTPQG